MATSIPLPISMSEYLHKSYQPDRDYVDGLVEERNLGERAHSAAQRALLAWTGRRQREWAVRALSEIRIQTSASHVRVADLALVSEAESDDRVIETPPVAVIEILSPEEDAQRYSDRLGDYRRMGVKNIWVVDPAARKGFDASAGEWVETSRFAVPDTPIEIDLAAVFAEIDKDRAR